MSDGAEWGVSYRAGPARIGSGGYRQRGFLRIHANCDNIVFHDSQHRVMSSAGGEQRIVLHLLTSYAPEAKPVEKLRAPFITVVM